jgi:DNA invertase Pin-like site-specific DNA recombinase
MHRLSSAARSDREKVVGERELARVDFAWNRGCSARCRRNPVSQARQSSLPSASSPSAQTYTDTQKHRTTEARLGVTRGHALHDKLCTLLLYAQLVERSNHVACLTRTNRHSHTNGGRAVAAIMASLAELELEFRRECRAASRASRRARQVPATKPTRLSQDRQEQLWRLAAIGVPVHELPKPFGIGRATAYR